MKYQIDNWKKAIISDNATALDAVKNLNETGFKIVIVVDQTGRFIGTITDGDIRRHLIHGKSLSDNVMRLTKVGAVHTSPETPKSDIEKLAQRKGIFEIPEIDSFGQVIGLNLLRHNFTQTPLTNKFVIMAGGLGTRMRPITNDIPKPLVPINGTPMIQHIIEFARDSGFSDFIVSVNYLSDKIKSFLKDGAWLGVTINYVTESIPLGTAGSLSLIKDNIKDPLVLCNADIITKLDFKDLLTFHCKNDADVTVTARVHETQNPFGVLNVKNGKIKSIKEKPIHRSLVSAGIYVLSHKSTSIYP